MVHRATAGRPYINRAGGGMALALTLRILDGARKRHAVKERRPA